MNTSDQLMEMLKTIDEAEAYLRKRCATGQAGQAFAMFRDLSGLLNLLDTRYRQSGYLPRERAPVVGENIDILSAIYFLDDVGAWTGRIKDRVERRRVRQELARGSLLDAVVSEGRPFAQQAVELSQFAKAVKPPPAPIPDTPGISGSPEERVELDKGVSVSFSSQAREAAAKAPAPLPPVKNTAPPEPEPAPIFDPAAEGERLFEGVRARTGRSGRSLTRNDNSSSNDDGEIQGNVNSTRANRLTRATPQEVTFEPRRNAAGESSTTRPMRAEPPEATSARPMRAEPPEATSARPMSHKSAPEQPKQMETTTTPAMGRGIAVDREFLRVFNELGNISVEDLEKKLLSDFPKLENRYKMVMCDHVRRFPLLGTLEPDRNDFSLLKRRAEELTTHRDEYSWLYGKLGDYRSRETLIALLDNWYSFNFKRLSNVKDKYFGMYFDADLLRCTDSEIFVDAGAGIGDTTKAFAEFSGHWKKIYCYEPCNRNFAALQKTVSGLSLTEIRQYALSDRIGRQSLVLSDDPLLSHLGDTGEEVKTVVLDEDIVGPISILKLCLEGGEQAAIRGCSNHIHKDHPRMIIRADHGDSDLWQIPRMLERLDKKYRFFLRHYGGNIVASDYVLYAI